MEESKGFYGTFFENFTKSFSSLFLDNTAKPLMFEVYSFLYVFNFNIFDD